MLILECNSMDYINDIQNYSKLRQLAGN